MGKNKFSGRKNNASPAQLANLKTFRDMAKEDPERHKELSRKGAIAGNQSILRRKTFKEACQWVAEQPAFKTSNEMVNALIDKYADQGLTNADAMSISLAVKAISEGDPRAFAAFRDTTGETIASQVDLASNQPMTINIRTIGSETPQDGNK